MGARHRNCALLTGNCRQDRCSAQHRNTPATSFDHLHVGIGHRSGTSHHLHSCNEGSILSRALIVWIEIGCVVADIYTSTHGPQPVEAHRVLHVAAGDPVATRQQDSCNGVHSSAAGAYDVHRPRCRQIEEARDRRFNGWGRGHSDAPGLGLA